MRSEAEGYFCGKFCVDGRSQFSSKDLWAVLWEPVGSVQCSAVQCSVVRCSAVQCSAVQCSAVQCSAVQCSAWH